jgi:acetoin utilization protein AcuC
MAAGGTGGKARPRHGQAKHGKRPLFIGSEIYRSSSYGARHPLAIPRVSTVIDLSRALGWLEDEVYLDSPRASPDELARFHAPAYVAAVMAAETRQWVSPDQRRRYNLGCNGNPVFAEMFRRPATACGGSLLGARLIAQGGTVYNPAGGTHHGRPAQANGFCYFNDPALAIHTLLDGGLARILYLDVDAHHGDGVQDAFAGDPRVLTVSLHEVGRWPLRHGNRAGTVQDRAGGQARNLPVPPGFNDSELDYLLEHAILPLAQAFAPEAVVLQGGADGLADDPMSRLELSNRALWRVVAAARDLAPRLLVLGGGGYNPWSVARCWTGVWATLNGLEVPARLPKKAEAILRALTWRHRLGRTPPEAWFTTLADPPRPGPIRAEVRTLTATVMETELRL